LRTKNPLHIAFLFFIVISLILCTQTVMPTTAQAATYNATINVDTTAANLKEINTHAVGINFETPVVRGYLDEDFLNKMIALQPGWIRMNGGTQTGALNWKVGSMDPEFTSQYADNFNRSLDFGLFQEKMDGRGGFSVNDFRELARKSQSKIIATVNVFSDSVESAYDFAKYVKDNNIRVEYWEMGNEAEYYNTGPVSVSNQIFFKNGTEYLNKARLYADAIKRVLPNAKIAVSYRAGNFDPDFGNYQSKYWDALVDHWYEGTNMASGNTALDDVNHYYNDTIMNANRADGKIIITESNVGLGAAINKTMYNAVYVAEYLTRTLSNPNIDYVDVHSTGQVILSTTSKSKIINNKISDAEEKDAIYDTKNADYGLYYTPVAYSFKLVSGAVREALGEYPVTVTGGTTVAKSSGTMPALFATAYKGRDKNYVLITNKSGDTHNVTLQSNGAALAELMNVSTVRSSTDDPNEQNTEASPNAIGIQTSTSTNPLSVPPYSVVRVEFSNSSPETVAAPVLDSIRIDTSAGAARLRFVRPAGDITNYNIKYGTSSGSYTLTKTVDNSSADVTVSGLVNGQTYYFAVSAVPAMGAESANSNELKVVLSAPSTPSITELRSFANDMTVMWQSVPYASGYKIKYGSASGTYTVMKDVGNVTGYVMDQLPTDTDQYVVVTAYNGIGESLNSIEKMVHVSNKIPVPPASFRVDKTSETSTSAVLKWFGAPAEVWQDNFEDNNTDDWAVTQGTWGVSTNSNINRDTKEYTASSTVASVTYYAAKSWSNYDMTATVNVNSFAVNGKAGIMARYQSDSKYYGLIVNAASNQVQLVRVLNGVTTQLAAASIDLTDVTTVKLTLRLVANQLTARVQPEGKPQINLNVTDTVAPIYAGKAGLYTLNQSASFDRISVSEFNSAKYAIWRSTTINGEYDKIAEVTGQTYTDTGLNASSKYYYKIKSMNSEGTSSNNYSGAIAVKSVVVQPSLQSTGNWKFENNELDSSGEGNDGTNHNGVYVKGQFGQGIELNGNAYVSISHDASLNFGAPSAPFTVSAWIKTSSSDGPIVTKSRPGQLTHIDYVLNLNQGKLRLMRWHESPNLSEGIYDSDGINLNDNTWHLVSFVNEGASSHKLYVDGQLAETSTTTWSYNDSNNQPLEIGRSKNYTYGTTYFTGDIDDVQVYQKALSAAEIANLYNK
jgi:hypothetical protein